MATGDMKNNIKQLQSELRAIKYSKNVDIEGLVSGSPKSYLSVYHYLFTSYSTKFNKDISNSNNELYGKSDMRFMEAVYKLLRDMFNYKPQITREQFFSSGYAERKAIMAAEVMRLVRGRYRPPKSTSVFKVMPSREESAESHGDQVHQEPFERPRKVAPPKPMLNMAGAIVLPSRHKSATGGFKVPKSAIASHRLVVDEGFQGGVVPMVQKAGGEGQVSVRRHEEVEVIDVVAVSPEETLQEPLHTLQSDQSHQSIGAEVRRKVVDLVSPALVRLNERIGKIDIALQNIEEKSKEQTKPDPEPPSSAALTAGLTKQLNDVIFKLDTLTSRVILLENRMMILEAAVDCGSVYSKNSTSSSSVSHTRDRYNPKATPTASKVHYVSSSYESHNKESSSPRLQENKISIHEDGMRENRKEVKEKEIVLVDVEDEDNAEKDEIRRSDMAFIKSLMTNDPTFLSQVESSAVETTVDAQNTDEDVVTQNAPQTRDAVRHKDDTSSKKPTLGTSLANTFGTIFSPIGPPQNKRVEDESVVSIPCDGYDGDQSDDRRSSTPTHFTLDTSTLSRANRINQMMKETQQLMQ